jgi:hypothetical protein
LSQQANYPRGEVVQIVETIERVDLANVILIAGGAVFLGDLAAVATIIASLWLERSLGVVREWVLDWIITVAASYGLAAWVAGHLLTRSMAHGRTELAPNEPDAPPTGRLSARVTYAASRRRST